MPWEFWVHGILSGPLGILCLFDTLGPFYSFKLFLLRCYCCYLRDEVTWQSVASNGVPICRSSSSELVRCKKQIFEMRWITACSPLRRYPIYIHDNLSFSSFICCWESTSSKFIIDDCGVPQMELGPGGWLEFPDPIAVTPMGPRHKKWAFISALEVIKPYNVLLLQVMYYSFCDVETVSFGIIFIAHMIFQLQHVLLWGSEAWFVVSG